MDIVIVFVGIYLAVSAAKMKKSGQISDLVVPKEEIKKCKDPEAYIRGITPWLYGFAAVAVVVGAIGILCDTKVITLGRIWTYVELGAFLAALFAFVSGMRKIKDKFSLKAVCGNGKKYIESDLEIQVKIKYNKCSTKEKVAGCGIA